MKIVSKIARRIKHLCKRPIRVFCLHHVCEKFDEGSMYSVDWMQIEDFKSKVQTMLQGGVEFIPLTDAYQHLCKDMFRYKKYAVLTFDDGYASLKEILPWLEEHQIPVTLFINGKYLDGKSYRENPTERYLTKQELFALASPLIEIGSHGWEHIDVCNMSLLNFKKSVIKNRELLRMHSRYIPFYAYTYGRHMAEEDEFLLSESLLPIYVSGTKNYKNTKYIDRELLK